MTNKERFPEGAKNTKDNQIFAPDGSSQQVKGKSHSAKGSNRGYRQK
ncbi:hypothetical protein [Bacillus tuaregi]|nr:hypothetical protein [Bacillus tuaregi]